MCVVWMVCCRMVRASMGGGAVIQAGEEELRAGVTLIGPP